MRIEVSEVKLTYLRPRLCQQRLQAEESRIESLHLGTLREAEVEVYWEKEVNSKLLAHPTEPLLNQIRRIKHINHSRTL
jgi:hypothetical protein